MSFGRSFAPWISSITMPRMSFAALNLYSLPFPPAPHDFLNLLFCAADVGRTGKTTGAGLGGATIAGVDAPDVGAVTLLAATNEPEPVPDCDCAYAVEVTESTESEHEVLCRLGNIDGILNPGEIGFTACGVFTTAAGVGVAGVSVGGVGEEGGCSIEPGSAEYACPDGEGGV